MGNNRRLQRSSQNWGKADEVGFPTEIRAAPGFSTARPNHSLISSSVSCLHVRQVPAERLGGVLGPVQTGEGRPATLKCREVGPREGNWRAASRTRGVINDGSGKADIPNSTLNPNGLSQPHGYCPPVYTRRNWALAHKECPNTTQLVSVWSRMLWGPQCLYLCHRYLPSHTDLVAFLPAFIMAHQNEKEHKWSHCH